MKLHSLEHVGTEAFPEPIEIDFDQLPDILVACGPIGTGKTTLLDLITASIYLTMPYRSGPLYQSFTKAGYVRVHLSHRGKRYHHVLTVDPKARKTEAQLFENDVLVGGPTQKAFNNQDAGNLRAVGPVPGDVVRRAVFADLDGAAGDVHGD